MAPEIPADRPVQPRAGSENNGPQKLWNPEDAVQPVVDLFNQGKISQATSSLKLLEDAAKGQEPGAWRHEIEVLNSKVDLTKLGLKDVGQIFGVDDQGNLLTVNARLVSGQVRSPEDPATPKDQFGLVEPPSFLALGSLDTTKLEQVERVKQYERDVEAGRKAEITPEQMNLHDSISPIVNDFNSGNFADGVAKLKALQTADSTLEPQQWLRHIEAVNCNLNLDKAGIKDASQIIGVDDKGNLITASLDKTKVQSRDASDLHHVLADQDVIPNLADYRPVGFWPEAPVFLPPAEPVMPIGQLKTTRDQMDTVDRVMKEADETRQPTLTPGHHILSITSDGEQREVEVYVGKDAGKNGPAKTWFLFHGAGPPPEQGLMENETDAHKFADDTGAVIVYPLAEEHREPVGKLTEGLWYGSIMKALVTGPNMDYHAWNSPGSGLNDTKTSYDDVHYVQSVDSLLGSKLNLGHRYLIGFSEGAEQARHTAAFMPDVAGVGLIHPASTGTEAPLKYPQAMVDVTGDLDVVLNRAGASTYVGALGNWEAQWPKMALSDPTRPFYEFARINGCSGAPNVENSADQIITEYAANQCTSGRPVTDVERKFGQHAVDGPEQLDFGARMVGKLVGSKDPSFDSFRFIADQLSRY